MSSRRDRHPLHLVCILLIFFSPSSLLLRPHRISVFTYPISEMVQNPFPAGCTVPSPRMGAAILPSIDCAGDLQAAKLL